jgi:hypothetical protein
MADEFDDGTFEIRLRLLGNEIFAISISANPLDKKWVSWALLISFVTVISLSIFGEPLANFYHSMVGGPNGPYEQLDR